VRASIAGNHHSQQQDDRLTTTGYPFYLPTQFKIYIFLLKKVLKGDPLSKNARLIKGIKNYIRDIMPLAALIIILLSAALLAQIVLIPLDLLSGLKVPTWVIGTTIVVLLTWCLGK
jgi:hypothetical protein